MTASQEIAVKTGRAAAVARSLETPALHAEIALCERIGYCPGWRAGLYQALLGERDARAAAGADGYRR